MSICIPPPQVPGSAVPAWLHELLPPWFLARPATTEALFAFSVSIKHTTYVVAVMAAGFAITAGATDSLPHLFTWLSANWLNILLGYFVGGGVGAQRAKQAREKATAAIEASSPVIAP